MTTSDSQPQIPAPDFDAGSDMPDADSKKEEQGFSEDDINKLRKDNEKRDMGRGDRLRHYIFVSTCFFIVVLTILGLAAICSLAWHYMTPSSWHYLSIEQIGSVKNIILSAASGALVSTVTNNYLKH